MADFQKTVNRINPDAFHVDNIPDGSQVNRILSANNYLRNWLNQGMIARYSGRADTTVNGNPTTSANSIYVFTRYPIRPDGTSTQRVGISASFWAKNFGGGVTALTSRTFEWYDDYTDGTPDTTYLSVLGSIANDTVIKTGPDNQFYGNVTPQSLATNEGFRLSKLTITWCYLAALSVYTLPADEITNANMYHMRPKNFVAFEAARGSTNADPGNSFGRLWWNLENGEPVVKSSSLCLFQTPYPLGAFVGSAGSYAPFQADQFGNPVRYRVRPRNLTGATTVQTDIACVVNTMTAGDRLQFASVTAGDTWTYTAPANITTPTIITTASGTGVAGAGLALSATGDEVTVKAQGADVHANTFSLWEAERV
jgi:hypothetical protein